MMFDADNGRAFLDLIRDLDFNNDEEQAFLQISSADYQQTMDKRLQRSTLISYDSDNRMLINIEHVDKDYLLKSSNDTSVRLPDDPRLFDKLFSFEQVLSKHQDELSIVHLCDFQSQYQCELFVILSKIVYPQYSHLKQCFLTLAPAVAGGDRPSTKYDELSTDRYMKEVMANIVNERTAASPSIPIAVLKLQLMCRKQSSTVQLRSDVGTNHDTLFLLYTGARLVSILNNYDRKHQNGSYPAREFFGERLGSMLMNKDEQEFLTWTETFECRFLIISLGDGNKVQINLDKIFQELILFSRRLSPYYSKVRILTESQSHLLPTMFARLELLDRIVALFRRTLALLAIPLIERM